MGKDLSGNENEASNQLESRQGGNYNLCVQNILEAEL